MSLHASNFGVIKDWYTIVNPIAGSGRCQRDWPEIEAHLDAAGVSHQNSLTDYHRHSSELAPMAIERGYRKFICVGGDGTFHNIVNGIMKQNMVPSKEITVAMVTVGTVTTGNNPKLHPDRISCPRHRIFQFRQER
ncbi:MAG TPA: hypothetical protein EYO59_10620 [Chromatiaceae bacterium]|nr:hypothetical protein [Chromatiaceae bacterium]